MHERDPDVVRTRIDAIWFGLCEIGSRQHSDTTPFPKGFRGLLAATENRHIEPKKEAPLRLPVTVAALKKGAGDGEILPVERASLLDMALVGPGFGRDMLYGQGHLRAGDVTEAAEGRNELWVAGDEADLRPGRPERFDSDWNATTLAKLAVSP